MTTMSPVDRRRLSGDGETTPPEALSSTSEGDMRKGTYRPSEFSRMFTEAVVNDDGTPINSTVEGLLTELLVEMRAIRKALEA